MSIYPTIYSKANPLAHASQVSLSLLPFPQSRRKKTFLSSSLSSPKNHHDQCLNNFHTLTSTLLINHWRYLYKSFKSRRILILWILKLIDYCLADLSFRVLDYLFKLLIFADLKKIGILWLVYFLCFELNWLHVS